MKPSEPQRDEGRDMGKNHSQVDDIKAGVEDNVDPKEKLRSVLEWTEWNGQKFIYHVESVE